MVTTYSQNDTLRGKEVWAVPICLILGAGLLIGGIKYINSQRNYQNPSPEIRAVQSQESVKGLEGLTKTREKWRRR